MSLLQYIFLLNLGQQGSRKFEVSSNNNLGDIIQNLEKKAKQSEIFLCKFLLIIKLMVSQLVEILLKIDKTL